MSVNTLRSDQVPTVIAPPPLAQRSGADSTSSGVGTMPDLDGDFKAIHFPLWLNMQGVDSQNGAFGAISPSICSGLALTTPGGLNVGATDGIACFGSWLYGLSVVPIAVPDNARSHIWLKQDQTLVSSTATAYPVGAAIYLGSVLTSAGVVTEVCDSGVLYSQGGLLLRRTYDNGKPVDSPEVPLVTKTLTGSYLWDGTNHLPLGNSGDLSAINFATDANFTATAAQIASKILEVTGAISAARTITVPLIPGIQKTVRNKTGQSVTLRVGVGTGVTIAASKAAIVYIDSADVTRLTADT